MPGLLSVVATPIGNLEDITLRALRILKEADVIACEDTRVTGQLLKHYEIEKPLLPVHQHTTDGVLEKICARIQAGERVAYVSDAGTPGVNDPGGKLVAHVAEAGLTIEVIPGSSALTAAMSVCGFPMERFRYVGFIPHKNGKQALLRAIAEDEQPVVFFESTHRILKTLEQLKASYSETRLIFVGRELTKKFETLYRGTIDEVLGALQASDTRGEFVVITAPSRL
ncbi:16S rRNA (cytidine(1402)-2'-O)-methyltransferase [Patescibacteria group bacterium]|nr:16S rRNA (cytidine(1402)-2'-O)-methyltransferase [Patescibacteria group bacterium]